MIKIDMYEVNDFLRLAMESAAKVNSAEVSEDGTRTVTQVRAEITKELLFAAHLCDRARSAAMDEYFKAKGNTAHLDDRE